MRQEPLQILLVEDQELERLLIIARLHKILDSAGISFAVTEAETASEGRDLLKNGHYAIVIVDIDTADLNDGYDVIKAAVGVEFASADQPYVIVRSGRSSEQKESLLEAGAHGLITKADPNELVDLERMLREAIPEMWPKPDTPDLDHN